MGSVALRISGALSSFSIAERAGQNFRGDAGLTKSSSCEGGMFAVSLDSNRETSENFTWGHPHLLFNGWTKPEKTSRQTDSTKP
jgi:hypothetical protein